MHADKPYVIKDHWKGKYHSRKVFNDDIVEWELACQKKKYGGLYVTNRSIAEEIKIMIRDAYDP